MSLSYHYGRFKWLREYYRHAYLDAVLTGCAFRDGQGTAIGYLEEARIKAGRLHLRGWTTAQKVSLRLGDAQVSCRPKLERRDVADAKGCDPHVGFRASLALEDAPLLIELRQDGRSLRIAHDLQIARSLARAERRLNRAFLRDLLPLLPKILRGLWRGDPDLPRRIKADLKLGHGTSEVTLNAAFLHQPGIPPQKNAGARALPPAACVILPIYNAFELLPETLQRLRDHSDLPVKVIMIEDCSSDPRVRPWLRDWVAQNPHDVELIENGENLGFIGSVNRALSHAMDSEAAGPIILLNSDAMVPSGWTSRLVAPLSDPAVASATPMSNDAEIYGAPVLCVPTALVEGQGDRIDAVLRRDIAPGAPSVTAPTGVGFCMALSRDWLRRLGGFDPIFGRGYGEEVDWCRRASANGGRHVAVPDLFVEHRGGASFGPEKLALIQKNNAVISGRYPGYDQLVQDFIRTDPLITPRLLAALVWADTLPDVAEIPVYIAHSMGGGAENYLQERIRQSPVAIVLRFGGPSRCRIEVHAPVGQITANTQDLALVARMLGVVSRRRVIYSCAVGDPDLAELPAFLRQVAGSAPLEVLFHDYLPLSPSYTLRDADGVYRGIPSPDSMDPAHCYARGDGAIVSLQDWRDLWGDVLAAADRVTVFSLSSARIVAEVYPDVTTKTVVVPHTLLQTIPPLARLDGRKKVVGVLGAIGPQKGAGVVSALARAMTADAAESNPDLGLAVIGRIAPGFPLGKHTPVHGSYAIEDIPALAARYGITHWLVPSVWPETFSYTVHECLATGLPTLAFDLGAQGDAVRVAANGIVLPWDETLSCPEHLAELVLDALR